MTDAPLRKALDEVFRGHEWIDFDWNGWRERARQALASPPVVSMDTGHGDVGAAGAEHIDTSDIPEVPAEWFTTAKLTEPK
jgi:hypothetical protein